MLIDGGFTRGSDVIKALALGARAVMLGRPPMWGSGGLWADGVRLVLELVQSELARIMVVVGRPTVPLIDRSLVKAHRYRAFKLHVARRDRRLGVGD